MPPPQENSQPRLAMGCRWSPSVDGKTLLVPEGAIRLQGTGLRVLELCDGIRSCQEIVQLLIQQYPEADAERIRSEAAQFLEKLHAKRIVDY